MLQPGRKFNAGGYRYGFNGKENDDDLHSLTAYDYGFRIYNPAIGRFLSVDPIAKKFPMLTPYQFASNTPIMAIDIDGLESAVANRKGLRYIIRVMDSKGNLIQDGTEFDYTTPNKKSNRPHQDIFMNVDKITTGTIDMDAGDNCCGAVLRIITYKDMGFGDGLRLFTVEADKEMGRQPPQQNVTPAMATLTPSVSFNPADVGGGILRPQNPGTDPTALSTAGAAALSTVIPQIAPSTNSVTTPGANALGTSTTTTVTTTTVPISVVINLTSTLSTTAGTTGGVTTTAAEAATTTALLNSRVTNIRNALIAGGVPANVITTGSVTGGAPQGIGPGGNLLQINVLSNVTTTTTTSCGNNSANCLGPMTDQNQTWQRKR